MPEPIQLTIRVRLEGGDAFPASFVAQTLRVIETEVFELEQEELEEIFHALDDVPPMVMDACRHRIERYKGNSLLVSSADHGSLVLAGVSAALAYWVVENTIGETIKDAYKASDLHRKLKGLLIRRFGSKNMKLERRLNERFFRPVSDPTVKAEAHIAANDPTVTDIIVRLNKWDGVPPTPSQWDMSANDARF